MHTCPNGKRYIGITMQKVNDRWKDGKGYKTNIYFNRAIQKYGWENIQHDVLFEELTKENAEAKEVELIAEHKTNDIKFGYNMESGGNHNGAVNPITKQRLSIAHTGLHKGEKNHFYGKTHTAETMLKIKKRVIQYSLTGKYIKTFDGAVDAAREVQGDLSSIAKACKGKQKQAYGFIWRYEKKNIAIETDLSHDMGVHIKQYSKDGEFIKEYKGATHAAKMNGFPESARTSIKDCCSKKQKTAFGFIWRYSDDDSVLDIENIGKWERKKINQYDKQGNFINSYISITEAVRQNNYSKFTISHISECLKGRGKSAQGFRWEYAQ